jgi:hypothetical protein
MTVGEGRQLSWNKTFRLDNLVLFTVAVREPLCSLVMKNLAACPFASSINCLKRHSVTMIL